MDHHHLETVAVQMTDETLIVFADGVIEQKFGQESHTDALSSFGGCRQSCTCGAVAVRSGTRCAKQSAQGFHHRAVVGVMVGQVERNAAQFVAGLFQGTRNIHQRRNSILYIVPATRLCLRETRE